MRAKCLSRENRTKLVNNGESRKRHENMAKIGCVCIITFRFMILVWER